MATKTNSHNEVRSASGVLATTVHVLLDRMQLHAWPRGNQLPEIPGFAVKRDTFVRRQTSIETYRRVRVLMNHKTTTTLKIQYRPAPPWLPPTKISIVTERRNGIRRSELERIIAVFRRVRPLLVEFAVDFTPNSGVGRAFILRHAVFGRSEQQHGYPFDTLRFGTRKSEKLVRAYRLDTGDFRVELELHSGWFLRNGVSKLEDLAYLPSLLFPRHFCLVAIDWQVLAAYISRKNRSSVDQILAQCHERATPLHGLLAYLRDELGVKNVRRFLRPLRINDAIESAAFDWARRWKQTPGGGE